MATSWQQGNRTAPTPQPWHRPPEAPLGTLGVIALAFGLGVFGAFMLDLHSHTCEGCGHTWRHLGAFNLGDPASHTCRRCGVVQWWKDGVPHVFRDVLRSPPPEITDRALAPAAGVPRPQLALTDSPWGSR